MKSVASPTSKVRVIVVSKLKCVEGIQLSDTETAILIIIADLATSEVPAIDRPE